MSCSTCLIRCITYSNAIVKWNAPVLCQIYCHLWSSSRWAIATHVPFLGRWSFECWNSIQRVKLAGLIFIYPLVTLNPGCHAPKKTLLLCWSACQYRVISIFTWRLYLMFSNLKRSFLSHSITIQLYLVQVLTFWTCTLFLILHR